MLLAGEDLPVAVWKAGVRWGGCLRWGSGRNGSRFVVLRVQSPVVDLQLGVMGFGRTFDVHERHRARHRDLAGLLLGAPRQQFDTLHAAIPATTTTTSSLRTGTKYGNYSIFWLIIIKFLQSQLHRGYGDHNRNKICWIRTYAIWSWHTIGGMIIGFSLI